MAIESGSGQDKSQEVTQTKDTSVPGGKSLDAQPINPGIPTRNTNPLRTASSTFFEPDRMRQQYVDAAIARSQALSTHLSQFPAEERMAESDRYAIAEYEGRKGTSDNKISPSVRPGSGLDWKSWTMNADEDELPSEAQEAAEVGSTIVPSIAADSESARSKEHSVESAMEKQPRLTAAEARNLILSGADPNLTARQRMALTGVLREIDAATRAGALPVGEQDYDPEDAVKAYELLPHERGSASQRATERVYDEVGKSLRDGDLLDEREILKHADRSTATARKVIANLEELGILEEDANPEGKPVLRVNARNVIAAPEDELPTEEREISAGLRPEGVIVSAVGGKLPTEESLADAKETDQPKETPEPDSMESTGESAEVSEAVTSLMGTPETPVRAERFYRVRSEEEIKNHREQLPDLLISGLSNDEILQRLQITKGMLRFDRDNLERDAIEQILAQAATEKGVPVAKLTDEQQMDALDKAKSTFHKEHIEPIYQERAGASRYARYTYDKRISAMRRHPQITAIQRARGVLATRLSQQERDE